MAGRYPALGGRFCGLGGPRRGLAGDSGGLAMLGRARAGRYDCFPVHPSSTVRAYSIGLGWAMRGQSWRAGIGRNGPSRALAGFSWAGLGQGSGRALKRAGGP